MPLQVQVNQEGNASTSPASSHLAFPEMCFLIFLLLCRLTSALQPNSTFTWQPVPTKEQILLRLWGAGLPTTWVRDGSAGGRYCGGHWADAYSTHQPWALPIPGMACNITQLCHGLSQSPGYLEPRAAWRIRADSGWISTHNRDSLGSSRYLICS